MYTGGPILDTVLFSTSKRLLVKNNTVYMFTGGPILDELRCASSLLQRDLKNSVAVTSKRIVSERDRRRAERGVGCIFVLVF